MPALLTRRTSKCPGYAGGAIRPKGVGRRATSTTINHCDEIIMSQGIETVIRGLRAGKAQMATWIKQASSIPGWEIGNGSLERRT